MRLYVNANLTVEFLAFFNSLNSVACLMKTCIAGVTINDLISVLTLRTKTDFAVSLKKTLHFL